MIDASIMLSLMLREASAADDASRLSRIGNRFTTAAALTEVALRLSSLHDTSQDLIERDIETLLDIFGIEVRDLPAGCWPLALHALFRFGKGRHPAKLNFGDCLAYAAAKHYRAPLLYKGDDFALTDVNDGY
jgi:ribonuclease VapC